MGWIPVGFWHHLVWQNLKTWICLLFSEYRWGVQKKSMISSLLIYNKFRYHTHKIRLEKLVPLNYRFPTEQKTIELNRPNRFQTRLLAEIWVSKIPGFVSGSPPGGFIFPEMTPNKICFWKCQKTSKIVIFWQNGYLFYAFSMFFFPHGSHGS